MNNLIQVDLFGRKTKEKQLNKIEDHWIDMPEYNSEDRSKPSFVAIIKFRDRKDFNEFNKRLKTHVFKKKFSWGTYKDNVRETWFPAKLIPSNYAYVDENDDDYKQLIDEL